MKKKIQQAIVDSPKYVLWLYNNKITPTTRIHMAHWTNTPKAWRDATTTLHHTNPSDVLIKFKDATNELGLSLKS